MSRILIVDDEKSIRHTLGQFLRDDGHEVVETHDADNALKCLSEKEFDVVVTDIILPRLTGVELLRRIRATAPHVQVVMMTGEPTVESASQSIRAGAADYLFKPISKAAILHVVANVLKLKTLDDTKRRLEEENRVQRGNLERLVDERTRQLRASEERARELSGFNQSVLDALTAHICVLSEDGIILTVNRAWEDFKAANSPLETKTNVGANYLTVCEAAIGEDKAKALEAVGGLRALARGNLSEYSLEYPCHSPDTRRWFLMRATRFADGGPVRIVVAHENITERKQLETELALREQRLQSFFSNATAGLCILDSDLRYIQVNEALARLNGLPASEHLGRTVSEVLPGMAAVLDPMFRGVLATGIPVLNLQLSGQMRGEVGGVRHWMGSYFPFVGEGGSTVALGCVVVEITEQKRAEGKLRESEQKFLQLADAIRDVFWICNQEITETIYISPAYEQVWGRSCLSLYAEPRSFVEAIHSDDRGRVTASLGRVQRGGSADEEFRLIRPDGAQRWIRAHVSAIRTAEGMVYRFAGLAQDITSHREMEEMLRQAQKMEAIGQLAGGVAHDFNNILAATLMHLGLLQQNPELTMGMKEALKDVEGETMRAANLTRQLLLFSRRQVARIEPLEVNVLINEVLKMLRRLLGENIQVEFQGSSDAMSVEADAGMMEQVIMNLCVNARDAMPKGGRIALATTMVEFGDQLGKSNPDARPGRFVCLAVTDTGCGMDETVLKRLFEPFFTTKEVGKGTGLGLATVFGIVKQHLGWIEVESAVGKGSSFRAYFPLMEKAAQKPSVIGPAEEMQRGSETILLVEDDRSLRRLAGLGLRKLGYNVIEATSGPEAVKLWEQHQQEIELLLADMLMPGEMTGLDLAHRFKAEKAALHVVIASGYSDALLQPDTSGPAVTFLAKPFKQATLARVVRQCLDETSPGDAQ